MDLLIFDMDGVLIDVSKSYRETIRQTIHIYLNTCLGFKVGKKGPISEEDITLFKSISGFNNDWDLTSGLLLYLLSISGLPPFKKKKRFPSIEEVVSQLKKRSSQFPCNLTRLLQKKHLPPFIKEVKSLGGGLKGVLRTSAGSWDGWVYRSGELDKENLVQRIFQEVYLGNQFTSHYHLPPLFYRGKGLYQREKLLITKEVLSSLRKKIQMGIASGRPRFEAELALKRFRLLPYFNSVVTLDECMEEEARFFRSTGRRMRFSKPHPYSLLRVTQEIDIPNPQCGYVGDVVDDMLAAQTAKKKLRMLAIGFLVGQKKGKAVKESLFRAGADLVIESPRDLLRLID
jgi:phosphoglycolate phosphatase-like HAD superfamily hydrolase